MGREIEVEGLHFSYGGVKVLEDVSFSVAPEEFVCVLGPSGCGKTTLLYILAGLYEAESGSVRVRGRPPTETDEVGLVFQEYGRVLLPWRSVIKNIALSLEVRGVPGVEARRIAGELVELTGLKGFERHLPAQLSGGMQQRVQLARVLAYDPAVLLMDEPFGALDSQTRELMQEELLKIWHARRKTVVFVTHDVDEAIFLADRILLMRSRPATIVESIEVDIERPRGWAVKDSSRFIELRRRVRGRLKAVS